jgi:hypothetical protein
LAKFAATPRVSRLVADRRCSSKLNTSFPML